MAVHVQPLHAINGTMTDDAIFDWKTLSNGDETTTTETKLDKPTFVELDLGGMGQLTDRLHITHPEGDMGSSNGKALYVMNEQRLIIMQTVFKITPDSKQKEEFAINIATPSPINTKTIQYLFLLRRELFT